ncbi:hypothetical protein BU24DRAFT_459199 [Aaosphaeria arxii CBS 175.79]|uniref:DUF6594 domain-containing protein n=1 Tax=Aaosphaeria arxii CBS 175.79 TaxID=1450172 RepID=A0A6A5Y4U1_9PLEO|nr:uncharacterized protein BU24DRAFT_459199 [Aaosphaeria arxii CBS 175.79]KAF2019534.1 hypothetical protein BU24DRAFT_459199 [Aaosphaeria arxii CBS 175.79]
MSEYPPTNISLTCTSEDADDRLATFMNHDSAFFIFRRFNALNLRHLLHSQAHLLSLEDKLEELKAQGHDADTSSHRERLMREVGYYLNTYNRALVEQSRLRTLGEPESVNVTGLTSQAKDHNALDVTEYLEVENDLITLGIGKEAKGWAYRKVEKILWKRFAKPSSSGVDPEAGSLYVYDDGNIQRSVRAILTSISTITLLVPVIIMFFIGNGFPSLVVVVICTALFSMFLAFTTKAQNHEVMMAAAA